MSFYRFPDRFCNDFRPYWVLLGLFMLANVLLVYTLYTRQPERYHRLLGRSFSSQPVKEQPAVPAQQARFTAPLAADAGANAWDRPAYRNPAWVAGLPPAGLETFEFLGMTLGNLRPNPARGTAQANSLPPRYGVRIVRIDKGSLPYLSGLRKGDIIVEVNRVPVYAVGDFQGIVRAASPQEGILLDVFRKDRFCYMTIEPAGPMRG